MLEDQVERQAYSQPLYTQVEMSQDLQVLRQLKRKRGMEHLGHQLMILIQLEANVAPQELKLLPLFMEVVLLPKQILNRGMELHG